MRKIFLLTFLLIMLVSFEGCKINGNIEKQNTEAKAALTKVLSKEASFITDKSKEETLEKYCFSTESDVCYGFASAAYSIPPMNYTFVPMSYTFVDLNSDGIDELIIHDAKGTYYLVLRYDNKNIYGYNVWIRDLLLLRTDGSFMRCGIHSEYTISTCKFRGKKLKFIDRAYMNENENTYLLNGKNSNKEEVEEYFRAWQKNTTEASSWEILINSNRECKSIIRNRKYIFFLVPTQKQDIQLL